MQFLWNSEEIFTVDLDQILVKNYVSAMTINLNLLILDKQRQHGGIARCENLEGKIRSY